MATKSEIKFLKQQDVSSTRNALRLAEQAEETGRGTLHRLGAQGERIHNTERNLDLASSQNRIAAEKARELKTLNKSMFAVHVGNPFTSGARREERDRRMLETHQQERAQRDATRKAAWESSARTQGATKGTQSMGGGLPKATLADRAKYQFEADSEDDEMENEIDNSKFCPPKDCLLDVSVFCDFEIFAPFLVFFSFFACVRSRLFSAVCWITHHRLLILLRRLILS